MNYIEQLEFKLEKFIEIQKHTGKIRKDYYSKISIDTQPKDNWQKT